MERNNKMPIITDKEKMLKKYVHEIVSELDEECPDYEAYEDGHCGLSELVLNTIKRRDEKIKAAYNCLICAGIVDSKDFMEVIENTLDILTDGEFSEVYKTKEN